jgi:hypothetical protein
MKKKPINMAVRDHTPLTSAVSFQKSARSSLGSTNPNAGANGVGAGADDDSEALTGNNMAIPLDDTMEIQPDPSASGTRTLPLVALAARLGSTFTMSPSRRTRT